MRVNEIIDVRRCRWKEKEYVSLSEGGGGGRGDNTFEGEGGGRQRTKGVRRGEEELREVNH